MLKVKVWNNNEWIEINDEMDFYVGRCSTGHTVFGESAKLHKILGSHLVFKTKSGALVKTEIDTLKTVGKAFKENYWVGIGDRTGMPNYINQSIRFWNGKKCCFEYK